MLLRLWRRNPVDKACRALLSREDFEEISARRGRRGMKGQRFLDSNLFFWCKISFENLLTFWGNSIRPLEHTPDPQPLVYEGNPFIFVFWGTWSMFQGSVGIFLDTSGNVGKTLTEGGDFDFTRFDRYLETVMLLKMVAPFYLDERMFRFFNGCYKDGTILLIEDDWS